MPSVITLRNNDTIPGSTTKSTINQPQAPNNLSAKQNSLNQVELSWSTPDGNWNSILGYKIERKTTGSYILLVDNTGDPETVIIDPDVTIGTSYTYRVSAITAEGLGPPSNPVTITLSTAPIFLYLELSNFGGVTQDLANVYASHQKTKDYLIIFNNAVNATNNGFKYLSQTMTDTVTLPKRGSTYSSIVDAANDVANLFLKKYGIQIWDCEPATGALTPIDQAPFNTPNCTIKSKNGTGDLLHSWGIANWQDTHQTFALGKLRLVKITNLVPGTICNRVLLNISTPAGNVAPVIYDDVNGVPTNKIVQVGGGLTALAGKNYYTIPGFVVPSGSAGNTSGVVWIGLENDNSSLDLVCSTGQASGSMKTKTASFGVFQNPLTGLADETTPFYCELGASGVGYGDSFALFTSFTNIAKSAPIPLQTGTTPFNMNDSDVLNITQAMDIYVIQLQPYINGDNPDFATLLSLYNKFAVDVIAANPTCKLIVQMSTTLSTLSQMKVAWDFLVANGLRKPDGVTIFFGATDGAGSGVAGTTANAITVIDGILSYIESES